MSGGRNPRGIARKMNNCYTLNISTNTLERKADMNMVREGHGLSKMDQKIFAFGGFNDAFDPMKSVEVYDVVKNLWNDLPNMPIASGAITCVTV